MAKITIDIVGLKDVERRLERLADATGDLTPVFEDLGEELLNSTRKRFRGQRGPDGRPWKPLLPQTLARKRKNQDKILFLEGELFGHLRYVAAADSLEVGSNEVYAATHQFGSGGDGRNIPARPFLGLDTADRADILRIRKKYLRDAL